MDFIIPFIQENIQWAPYIFFGLFLLSGFNIPISEDALLFISAILAIKNPDMIVPLFLSVYLGAYISDLICYWLGRYLGPKLRKIRLFASMISDEKIEKISNYYNNYGILTLILGRFVPFGLRNALFLTAGLGKMNFMKFILSDLLACTISTTTYFYLYYSFGEQVIEYVKRGNMVIFGLFIIVVLAIFLKKKFGHPDQPKQ